MSKQHSKPRRLDEANSTGRRTGENWRIPEAAQVEVPVGMELLILRAAQDSTFRNLLLSDREVALGQSRIELRPSERNMLRSIPNGALEQMIARVVPNNPRRRTFMNKVATAAATLAAGTVAASVTTGCDQAVDGGASPAVEVDGKPDAAAPEAPPSEGVRTDQDNDAGAKAVNPRLRGLRR